MTTTVDQNSGVSTNQVEHVSDLATLWAERSPDRLVLAEAAGCWTYEQLKRAVSEAKVWLGASGVRPGDRVMIVGENSRAFVAILLALTSLDAWPVPVNARLLPREIDGVRDHCGARRVVYTPGPSLRPHKHAQCNGAAIKDVGDLGPVAIGPLDANVEPEPVPSNRAERVAALIYTSGSTGRPKGVMLTHRNLLFAATGSSKIRALRPRDRLSGILPMSHVAGLSVALLGTLISGAALYLSQRFEPGATLQSLERDRLTVLLGTPAMFALLVEYAALKGLASSKFPHLRIVSSAGAQVQPSLKAAAEKLFGLPLQNAYGMTECSPNIAQTRIEAPLCDTSVGPVFPGVEIKLTGPDQQPVGAGAAGELWVRGPNVMKGYYRAPEETAVSMDAEGWFRTGDLARLENGNLYIVGRTKELIVRFGFNVSPAEVEAVLNLHPAVSRSAVFGQPVAAVEGGERIVAFVQPLPGASPTVDELADHAARELSVYKRPSKIWVIPSIPLTANGKVAKDKLVKMAVD
ncbi:MAG TPA: class I adenylate-forming enzyme family protein [Terriglobia bacterium]|nr:class I adenylate-forming enzyme family protein [Terriglobia bacterium]